MRLRADYVSVLHSIRTRELGVAFAGVPAHAFRHGLELGAGDGFQSNLLTQWVDELVSTDINPLLLPHDTAQITYRVVDAELLPQFFTASSFDLVFSSSMLAHVPDPQRVLRGVYSVLRDDGLTIHVVPGPWFKLAQFVMWWPAQVVAAAELVVSGEARRLVRGVQRRITGRPALASAESPAWRTTNNPKSDEQAAPGAALRLLPPIHGVSRRHRDEFAAFSVARWRREFELAGFEVVDIMKGPVFSGYGFGWETIRRQLERRGIASEYIYRARKRAASIEV